MKSEFRSVERGISAGIAIALPACTAAHRLDTSDRLRVAALLVQQSQTLLHHADSLMASVCGPAVRRPTRTDRRGVVVDSNPTSCEGHGTPRVKAEPLPADSRPDVLADRRTRVGRTARGRSGSS